MFYGNTKISIKNYGVIYHDGFGKILSIKRFETKSEALNEYRQNKGFFRDLVDKNGLTPDIEDAQYSDDPAFFLPLCI